MYNGTCLWTPNSKERTVVRDKTNEELMERGKGIFLGKTESWSESGKQTVMG